MPLTWYQRRSPYSLADPELYGAADTDDPEALLEGVAMAALVGVLRQLGDLAEFAAEIFHNLHDEVMATAARSHGVVLRVQQLEAELPLIEKAFLSQTNHSSFFSNAGVDWHPNLHMDQNLVTRGDIPRFVMDLYEECWGPPRLFLLDKFDIAGDGACLKRYTDPSFFKEEASLYELENPGRKIHKPKKKGSCLWNEETSDILTSSHAELHQLFLEKHLENGLSATAHCVKLKRRLKVFPFDSKTRKSYMLTILKTPSPEHQGIHEIAVSSPYPRLPFNIAGESGLDVAQINTLNPGMDSLQGSECPCSPPYIEETLLKSSVNDSDDEVTDNNSEIHEANTNFEVENTLSTLNKVVNEKEIAVDRESKIVGFADGCQSDDGNEMENFMDALATMELEMDMGTGYRAKTDIGFLNFEKQRTFSNAKEGKLEEEAQSSSSQSLGNTTMSDDGNGSSKKEKCSLSYSDSLSNLAGKRLSDGDTIFPSTKTGEAEVINMFCGKQSVTETTPVVQHPVNVIPHDSLPVAEIPCFTSEFGEPSSGSCLTDAAPRLPLDQGASLCEVALAGPEMGEISSNCNVAYTKENGTNQFASLPGSHNLSDVPSQTRDHFLNIVSAECHPFKELDNEDSKLFFDASLHFLNTLELAAEKRSENTSEDGFQTEDGCKILADDLDLPESLTSHTEKQLTGLALTELDVKPYCTIDHEDDAILAASKVAMSVAPVVEIPHTSNFTKQHISEIKDDVPSLELDTVEVCISYSEGKNLDVVFTRAKGEEKSEFTLDSDRVGQEATSLEVVSNSPTSSGFMFMPAIPIHMQLSDRETEIARSENFITSVSSAAASTDADGGTDANSLFVELQEGSLSNFVDLCENVLESNKAHLSLHIRQSCTEKEVDQWAIASLDVVSVECGRVSNNNSYPELPSNLPDLTMAKRAENCLHPEESPAVSSPHQNLLDSLSKSAQQSNFIENSVDATLPLTPYPVQPRIPLEQKVDLQTDQPSVEYRDAGEASSASSFQLERMQHPNDWDWERCIDTSTNFDSAHPPSQPSVSEFLPQSGDHLLDVSKPATDPLSPFFPAFSLLLEANQIFMEEMSPLPPLPPVQWRTGKSQHASLISEPYLVQHNLYHFSPISSSTADEKSQLSYPSKEEIITHSTNPFLPVSAVQADTSQHLYENLAGGTCAKNPFLVSPAIKSDEMSQQGFFVSEGGTVPPIYNPFSIETCIEDTAYTNIPRPQANIIQHVHQLPRHPLIDAIAAHDKSKLRKVTEPFCPQVGKEVDETDSLLKQIREKSFNLKPAVVTRPNTGGPKTNLKVSAILEKASAIRQALVGSDEDDDADCRKLMH